MIVQTPPVLIQHDDGRWYLEVLMPGGQESVLAPVGDGAWLFQQLSEKLIVPALRTIQQVADAQALESKPMSDRMIVISTSSGMPLVLYPDMFNQPYEG